MKAFKELAGQTIVYGVGTIVPRIFNYLLTPLYTYVLIESNFGIITEMYSYVAFFMVLLTFGMETTFFRFTNLGHKKESVFSNAFLTLLITSTIFLILVFFNVNSISNILGSSNYKSYVILMAFIIFFDVMSAVPLAQLRQDNRAYFFTVIRIVNVLINLLLNIFFFVICRNSKIDFLNGLYNENFNVGYAFVSNLCASLVTFLILLPKIIVTKFTVDKVLFKKMISFAWPLLIVGLAGMINEVADKLFIKYLTPEQLNPLKQVGIYGANYKLAILMTIFIQIFKYAAEPFFFKQSSQKNAKEIYSRVMTYFVIFCLFIFLVVTLYIDVFKYFIGNNYRIGLKIVPVVLLANMFLGIYYNLAIWYKLTNKTYWGAIISTAGAIITVIINVIFIPLYGYISSAWATFACYFIMVLLSYIIGKKHYRINYNIKLILAYFAIAIIIFSCIKFINVQNMFISILLSTFGILVFIACVLKIEHITVDKLKLILKK